MTRRECWIFAVALSFITLGVLAGITGSAEVPRIGKEELKGMLNDPQVAILDVRTSGDWDSSSTKIQGAIREDPNKSAKSWADKYSKDKTIVLY